MTKDNNLDDLHELIAQVNAEPKLWHVESQAYAPKVIIKNNIYPAPHEIYNCTSCSQGEPEHPAYKAKNQNEFRVKCKLNKMWNTGPRFEDIGCRNWERKIPRPKKLDD